MHIGDIVVIGGSGFLGCHVSRLLENSQFSHTIADLHNGADFSNYFRADVTDISSLRKLAGAKCFINLAAEHRDDVIPVSKYDDVNVEGAKNVCQAASELGVEKIVFTSSVAIYGFASSKTDESGQPNYFNDYGRTKYLAEQVYLEWQKMEPEKRTLVILRPTVIFGEGNRGNVFNLFQQIQKKRFVMIGNGRNKKSMAYVENVSACVIHCLSFDRGVHIYNYVDEPSFDMNTLVTIIRSTLFNKNNTGFRIPKLFGLFVGLIFDMFGKIIGKSFSISRIRMKKFTSNSEFSTSIKNTGFVPKIKLRDALIKTLNHEFKNKPSEKL